MAAVISFINSKGGVGKTTIAWTLATLWAGQGRRVLLVDTDPQATLTEFFSKREDKGGMEAIAIPLARLLPRLQREVDAKEWDFVLIDTPGRIAEIQPAIDGAGVIVMPIQPSAADFFAFTRIFQVCFEAGARIVVVPNRVKTASESSDIGPTMAAISRGSATIGPLLADRVGYRKHTLDGKSIVDAEPASSPGVVEMTALAGLLENICNGANVKTPA